LLVPFLEGLEAAMPPGYSAVVGNVPVNGNALATYSTLSSWTKN